MDSLIQILRTGSPRAAYQAGKELVGFGHAAEEPLIGLLRAQQDPFKQREILNILQAIKISKPDSVERVVQLLRHPQDFVRGPAAQCLLHSSPKLRQYIPLIQAAFKQEKDAQIKATLQKLLSRYPGGS